MDVSQGLPEALQAAVGLGGVGVVKHLEEALFKPFVKDSRFYPLAAIVLGVVWNVSLAYVMGLPLAVSALIGVLTGLSASGDYDSGKANQAQA
jgi:hypothetical protein